MLKSQQNCNIKATAFTVLYNTNRLKEITKNLGFLLSKFSHKTLNTHKILHDSADALDVISRLR